MEAREYLREFFLYEVPLLPYERSVREHMHFMFDLKWSGRRLLRIIFPFWRSIYVGFPAMVQTEYFPRFAQDTTYCRDP